MSILGFAWALERGATLGLPVADRMVLIYLADKANGIGVCWPGQETIVRFTGLAIRTVRAAVRRLEGLHLISLEEAPGVATRYHINRELTPANGNGGNVANPGNLEQGHPGKPARGNVHHPGKPDQGNPATSLQGPRNITAATPANGTPEPLREPLREPRGARGAREGKASVGINSHSSQEHIQPAPHLLPGPHYASPDEARATFAAYLAAKRREAHPEEEAPEPKASAKQVRRAAAATIYSLRKYAPAEGVKPERSRSEQIDAVLRPTANVIGEIMPPIRRGPLDPIRTVAEQLAALGHPQTAEHAP